MKLAILGASGHGKVIADIAELVGYEEIVFLDDNTTLQTCGEYSVVGTCPQAIEYSKKGYKIAVGIGNADIREHFFNWLNHSGIRILTLIHPSAVIAKDVSIGEGTVVMAGVIINAGAKLGKGCIVNTASSVDHDNVLGDYSHISVGAHLAGTVQVGERTWIGAGAVVSNNISICANCVVGAGAVVVRNITESGVYVGCPARLLKRERE